MHKLCNAKKAGIGPTEDRLGRLRPPQNRDTGPCPVIVCIGFHRAGGQTAVTQILWVAEGLVPLGQGKKPVPRSLTIDLAPGRDSWALLLGPGFGN